MGQNGIKWLKVVQKGSPLIERKFCRLTWFVGAYEHALDEKGRVVLPSKFRKHFSDNSYLSVHDDGCLALWTAEQFESQAVKRLESDQEGALLDRNLARRWAASVQEVKVDSQGRLPIPLKLREFANLSGEIVINGVMNRVEIWNKEKWLAIDSMPMDVA